MIVKVGYADFTVEHTDILDDRDGQCDTSKHLIHLQTGMNPRREAEVLLHEVIHAIYDVWGLRSANLDEETIVNSLGCGLATVIRDNPEFVRLMMKSLK